MTVEPTEIELSDDQSEALARVLDWYRGRQTPLLTLGGYAGTGKTTLIREMVRLVGDSRVAVCAYTGKAAHVLRSKGISKAKTIHSTIYTPEKRCKLCQRVVEGEWCSFEPACLRAGTTTAWPLVQILDADLVIVDEASMVSAEIHADLLSFGVPLLYVGDHGQLEPIGNNPRLMIEPMVRLEKIHRQAAGSPILRFAHHVRQHGAPETTGDEARVEWTAHVPRNAHEYDMVLCGKNSTRVAINKMVRRALDFDGDLPQVGERVVCLRNNKEHAIFNGMLATVLAVRADEFVDHPELDIVDDDSNIKRGIRFAPEQFGDPEKHDKASSRKALFDWGYALTVHKSQGSAWPRVLVIEQMPHPNTSLARWRYTAATRAAKELVWCMRPHKDVF